MFNLHLDKRSFYFSEHAISLEPYSIMVKKDNKALLNFVNSELRTYYKSGFAKSTLDKHFKYSNLSINGLTFDLFRNPATENSVP